MVTVELLSYIKGQISHGQTSEFIKTTLLSQGWNEADISQAFVQVSTEQSNQTSQQHSPSFQNPMNNNQKQGIDATIDKSTIIQSQELGQIANAKESIYKYVAYFLTGLILSLLGLFIGVIWIVVKEKQNKMRKIITLLVGVIMSVVFWFILVGGVQVSGETSNIALQKSPEAHEIQSDLTNLFPSLTYEVTFGVHNPPMTLGNTLISSFITVRIVSKKTVTAAEVTEVGKQVCSTIDKLQKDVSQVQVETVQTKYIIFSSSKGVGGTCEEWNSGKI